MQSYYKVDFYDESVCLNSYAWLYNKYQHFHSVFPSFTSNNLYLNHYVFIDKRGHGIVS